MDVKVAFVIACLCALCVTSSEAFIPRCCVKTVNHIPKSLIHKVYKIELQKSSGACDIDAIILYVKNMQKPICVNPKVFGWNMRIHKRKP